MTSQILQRKSLEMQYTSYTSIHVVIKRQQSILRIVHNMYNAYVGAYAVWYNICKRMKMFVDAYKNVNPSLDMCATLINNITNDISASNVFNDEFYIRIRPFVSLRDACLFRLKNCNHNVCTEGVYTKCCFNAYLHTWIELENVMRINDEEIEYVNSLCSTSSQVHFQHINICKIANDIDIMIRNSDEYKAFVISTMSSTVPWYVECIQSINDVNDVYMQNI